MKKPTIILIILLMGLAFSLNKFLHNFLPLGNEFSYEIQHHDGTQEKLISKLKEKQIQHVVTENGAIKFRKKDSEIVHEISNSIIKDNYKPTLLKTPKPNIFLYQEGANEYLIELLENHDIPHYIERDKTNKITKISWDVENNRASLEQLLKVNEKLGQTDSPTSIKFMFPETQVEFEKKLKEKGYSYTRNGEYTSYGWENWVDIEIIKSEISKLELERAMQEN